MARLTSMHVIVSVVLATCAYTDVEGQATQPVSSMQRLRQKLLVNHSRQIRPVADNRLPVPMNISVSYGALLHISNIQQDIQSLLRIELHWHDHFLQWDSYDYDGIDYFTTTTNDIWIPEMRISNAKDDSRYFTADQTFVTVWHDGLVRWSANLLSTTICSLDMTFFPFDNQKCEIRIFFQQNSFELEIVHSSVTSGELFQVIRRPLEAESFIPFFVYVELQRRPFFYVMTVLFPMMMLSLLSSCSFCVSGASGEKLTFALTVLLSQSVLSSFTSSLLPTTSDEISITVLYVFAVLVHNTACVLAVVYSINVFTRTSSPVTCRGPILSLAARLANVRLFGRACADQFSVPKSNQVGHETHSVAAVQDLDARREDKNYGTSIASQATRTTNETGKEMDTFAAMDKTSDIVCWNQDGRNTGQVHSRRAERKKDGRDHAKLQPAFQSWKEASKALDRFFLCVFWLSNVVINLTYFLYAAIQ